MWEIFLIGFAYLDAGLTILVTYFTVPFILACLGIAYLHKRYIKFAKRRKVR